MKVGCERDSFLASPSGLNRVAASQRFLQQFWDDRQDPDAELGERIVELMSYSLDQV